MWIANWVAEVLGVSLGVAAGLLAALWLADCWSLWPEWVGPLKELLETTIIRARQS